MAAAESCIKALDLNAVRGLIVSGDAFINGSVGLAKIRHNFPQAIAVEMEATAIAHVCHNFKVPFVVVRAISDVADQQSHLSFEEFLAVAARQSTLMVENLVQNRHVAKSLSFALAALLLLAPAWLLAAPRVITLSPPIPNWPLPPGSRQSASAAIPIILRRPKRSNRLPAGRE